ncbi:hypothetical protein H9S87_19020 (plasmid) [Bacillus pumilus]|uniref:hypothetical protein n=1 Tax=Bacillus pumilus TaxID=1408 RepID=UPI001658241E|nr:hypothetical protein [Bacillus pumilus]QNP18267.1 hypothetical protein H9S87_19020 [Bacillus pumilus]
MKIPYKLPEHFNSKDFYIDYVEIEQKQKVIKKRKPLNGVVSLNVKLKDGTELKRCFLFSAADDPESHAIINLNSATKLLKNEEVVYLQQFDENFGDFSGNVLVTDIDSYQLYLVDMNELGPLCLWNPKNHSLFKARELLNRKRKAHERKGPILLFSKEEFDELEKYCIGENYSSPYPTKVGRDVRFADFTEVKDIILKNGSFNLMVFNDYEKEVSTLITFFSIDNLHELGKDEYKFTSLDEFYSKLNEYKRYLSEKNGTIQVIEWIINNSTSK